MPTTFNVISLGNYAAIDPTEGNTQSENASSLVGLTFGNLENPLWEQVQSLSPGSTGFGGGTASAYDMNNSLSNDTFRLNGGPDQTFDGTAVYNATLTYTDGTTGTITAVVFQDTAGNTYLAPEFSANADQATLEAGAIRSMTLTSLVGNNYSGMTGSRETFNAAVCFAAGTKIATPDGLKDVARLVPGDRVMTVDNGPQVVRWVGIRTVPAIANHAPIRIRAGALGRGVPEHDLIVSRQHRVLLRSRVAQRMFGQSEVLVSACRLTPLPGVEEVRDWGIVTWCHLMCDRHEVIWAAGAPAETLYLGPEARQMLSDAALDEILALFPELADHPGLPARPMPDGRKQKELIARLVKNHRTPVESAT
ncbi:Hint domain-containing protein [Pseudaestuariivita atlantica]|uniref:Hemolysin n=1 Tax=Pseudaestuariivita atlantica TaxID=1317121 RepID=A0A0L1JR19_9RHOB|nr:Hint domain-containing protein [Pseudaestuariivita atlantica]KNG93848.1 hemolysin [Pseudaestuariivita atlantica]